LTDKFVAGLLAAADTLLTADPGAWVAFELMTWGGLRNKEAYHARESWLEPITAGSPPAVTSYRLSMKPTKDFIPKGNSRAVILPANIAAAILALQPAKNPVTDKKDDHLVPADHESDRHDAVYRRLNAWLKKQGVDEEAGKLAYRLRKYFLAKVAEQQGLMFAQAAAGHSKLSTTQDHYIGKPKMTSPIALVPAAAG
jgi:integrase